MTWLLSLFTGKTDWKIYSILGLVLLLVLGWFYMERERLQAQLQAETARLEAMAAERDRMAQIARENAAAAQEAAQRAKATDGIVADLRSEISKTQSRSKPLTRRILNEAPVAPAGCPALSPALGYSLDRLRELQAASRADRGREDPAPGQPVDLRPRP